ncbi:MAG: RNA polymerase sigma factor [Planctomycetota bacterium]|nr:RNA polymerase sigma factor [Planctomycetota bacterium]
MQDDCALTLTELVEQHYSLLYRYGYRLSGSHPDAEDLVQQTFLIAQTKLEQLREPSQAHSWLCVILRNVYFKAYQRKKQLNVVEVEELNSVVGDETPSIDDRQIDETTLQSALDELPDDYRATLILFYFEEFSYKEIAEQLDVPIGTVMSRLARGKSHLRKRLASKMND